MPHGVHAKDQLNVRLPPDLLSRLKDGAKRYGHTVTDIVTRGTTAELDRLDGIATEPVSPPVPAGKNCKHRGMKLSKGVCPDCNQWVTKESKR